MASSSSSAAVSTVADASVFLGGIVNEGVFAFDTVCEGWVSDGGRFSPLLY